MAWATVLACLCSSSMLPISSSKKAKLANSLSQLWARLRSLRVHGLLAPSLTH